MLRIRRIMSFHILGWWTFSLSVACSWMESVAQIMVRVFESPGALQNKAHTLELVFAQEYIGNTLARQLRIRMAAPRASQTRRPNLGSPRVVNLLLPEHGELWRPYGSEIHQ